MCVCACAVLEGIGGRWVIIAALLLFLAVGLTHNYTNSNVLVHAYAH